MKTLLKIFLFLAASEWVYSQDIDYNKIVLPLKIRSTSFEERLVQLAWKNHPTNKIVAQGVELSKTKRTIARLSFLDRISASGNLNEFTLDPSRDVNNRSNFFPRYNLGVNFSLGTVFATPIQIKGAKIEYETSQLKVNERMIAVRSEILTALESLKELHQLLRLRQRMEEDYLVMSNDAEKKFSAGQILMQEYRDAIEAHAGRSADVIQAKSQFNQAKIAVEALVGMSLEEIEGYADYLKQQEAN